MRAAVVAVLVAAAGNTANPVAIALEAVGTAVTAAGAKSDHMR